MSEEDWGGLDVGALEDQHRAEMDDLARDERAGEFRSSIRAEAVANVAHILGLTEEEVRRDCEVLIDAEETMIWEKLDEY